MSMSDSTVKFFSATVLFLTDLEFRTVNNIGLEVQGGVEVRNACNIM